MHRLLARAGSEADYPWVGADPASIRGHDMIKAASCLCLLAAGTECPYAGKGRWYVVASNLRFQEAHIKVSSVADKEGAIRFGGNPGLDATGGMEIAMSIPPAYTLPDGTHAGTREDELECRLGPLASRPPRVQLTYKVERSVVTDEGGLERCSGGPHKFWRQIELPRTQVGGRS